MKSIAKSLLRRAVPILPWGARDTLLRALIEKYGGETVLMEHLAQRAGITGFIAHGEHGAIQSATGDRRILLTYARTGGWAAETVRIFREFFAPGGGTYLDIGANIGLTLIPIARDPRVRCAGFEPDPTNFANLTDNVRRNAAGADVALHRLALFDRAGSIAFGLAGDGNLGDHRIARADVRPTEGLERRTIEVACARLDDTMEPPPAPLGVKLDAQGAEPFIVAGGELVLARAGLVALEFSPMLMEQLGGDPEVLIGFLEGFEHFRVARGDSGAAPEEVGRAAIRKMLADAFERGRRDDRDYLDIYATRAVSR